MVDPPHAAAARGATVRALDDQLVLGLSIDDEQEEMENVAKAKTAMQELAKEFGAKMGVLGTELPPPETESVFVKEGEGELALYFERFGPAA